MRGSPHKIFALNLPAVCSPGRRNAGRRGRFAQRITKVIKRAYYA